MTETNVYDLADYWENRFQDFAAMDKGARKLEIPDLCRDIRGSQGPSSEVLTVLVHRHGAAEQAALENAVEYVRNLRFVETDDLKPFEGTATVVSIDNSGRVRAFVKHVSEQLEAEYGDLAKPACIKALLTLHVVLSGYNHQHARLGTPSTNAVLRDALGETVYLGGAQFAASNGSDNRNFGVSGFEATRGMIRWMFPKEKFDFEKPGQLERGAGKVDEAANRLISGYMGAQIWVAAGQTPQLPNVISLPRDLSREFIAGAEKCGLEIN